LSWRKINVGAKTGILPNVSFRNGGRIHSAANPGLAPNVFITASDYRFAAEEEIQIFGNDIWFASESFITLELLI